MADGDDSYYLEVPDEHSMEELSMSHKDPDTGMSLEEKLAGEETVGEYVFESAESLPHDDECSTPCLVLIAHHGACACLALDGLGAVG
jgi:hypothetical protein